MAIAISNMKTIGAIAPAESISSLISSKSSLENKYEAIKRGKPLNLEKAIRENLNGADYMCVSIFCRNYYERRTDEIREQREIEEAIRPYVYKGVKIAATIGGIVGLLYGSETNNTLGIFLSGAGSSALFAFLEKETHFLTEKVYGPEREEREQAYTLKFQTLKRLNKIYD